MNDQNQNQPADLLSEEQRDREQVAPTKGNEAKESPGEAEQETAGQAIAVAPREPKPPVEAGAQGYILPTNMDEAYRLAVGVVRGNLAPASYDNDPSKVMLGILAAMEAGLPPLFGLRNIAIVNGRPTIWGDAAIAVVQGAGLIVKQVRREVGASFDPASPREQWPDSFGYSVSLFRRGQEDPYVGVFTIADAKQAGLWTKKGPWIQYPKRMLEIRARTFALRDGFADALAGLAIREEVEDYSEAAAPTVTDARRALLTDTGTAPESGEEQEATDE